MKSKKETKPPRPVRRPATAKRARSSGPRPPRAKPATLSPEQVIPAMQGVLRQIGSGRPVPEIIAEFRAHGAPFATELEKMIDERQRKLDEWIAAGVKSRETGDLEATMRYFNPSGRLDDGFDDID